MSLGLKRGTVQLEPHDKLWDEFAVQIIKTLKSILGDDFIDIQHIGSTAIPAIKAKPMIDIVVGVTDFDRIMSLIPDSFGLSGFCEPSGSIPVYGDTLRRIRIHTVRPFFHIYYISHAVFS